MENQVLSISQMQELIELGIDISKASMCWFPKMALDNNKKSFVESYFLDINRVNCDAYWNTREGKKTIPTFTLQDIFEILPKYLFVDLETDSEKDYYITSNLLDTIEYITGDDGDTPFIVISRNTLLEAAFEILKWCKENNYIF